MQSSTYSPLLQFAQFIGLDGWFANGIDRSLNSHTKKKSQSYNECDCLLPHVWMTKQHMTLNDLEEILKLGEQLFIAETGLYPSRKQVINESHNYPKRTWKTKKYPFIVPEHSCDFYSFGVMKPIKIATVSLYKTNEQNEALDEFKWTFQLPEGYHQVQKDDLMFSFTWEDYEWYDDEEAKRAEIRPIRNIIIASDGSVTAKAPAFLFKKPELMDADYCLPHAPDTYVNCIDVYMWTVDIEEQGKFLCNSSPCEEYPCNINEYPLCMTRHKENRTHGYPTPATIFCNQKPLVSNCCDLTYPLKRYELCCWPQQVNINYIVGKELNNGFVNRDYFRAIALLGISLTDCLRDICDCPRCTTSKLNYYRSIPKFKIAEGQSGGPVGDQWQRIEAEELEKQIQGLEPNVGILQAFRIINKLKCSDNFTGMML